MTRQNTGFKNRIRRLPGRLTRHSRSSSDTALTLEAEYSRSTTLRHRGVDFEILNPQKPPIPHSVSTNAVHQSPSLASSWGRKNRSQPTVSGDSRRSKDNTATPSVLKAANEEYRATPPRTLFEDLHTAYSSILSRQAHHELDVPLFFDDGAGHVNSSRENLNCTDEFHGSYPDTYTPESQSPLQPKALPIAQQKASSRNIPPGHPTATTIKPDSHAGEGDSQGWMQRWSRAISKKSSDRFETCCLPLNSKFGRSGSMRAKTRPSKLVKHRQWTPQNFSSRANRERDENSTLFHFLNRHQPNLHSARGRVDKANAVGDIIKRCSTRCTKHCSRDLRRTIELMKTDSYGFAPQDCGLEANQSYAEINEFDGPVASQESDPPAHDINEPCYPPNWPIRSDSADIRNYTGVTEAQNHGHSRSTSVPYVPQPNIRTKTHVRLSEPPSTTPLLAQESTANGSGDSSSFRPISTRPSANDIRRINPLSSHPCNNEEPEPCLAPKDLNRRPIPWNWSAKSGYMGPGSSQSSSTQQMSQRDWSFATLKSRLGVHSSLSSDLKAMGRKDKSTRKSLSRKLSQITQSSFHSQDDAQSQKSRHYPYRSTDLYFERDDYDDDCDDRDWETVAESQQFRGGIRRSLAHVDTGSSLANFSSFGSLAATDRQHSFFLSQQDNQTDTSSRSTMPHPAHAYRPRRYPGPQRIRPPYCQHDPNRFVHPNAVKASTPVLLPTGHKYPAPRLVSTSRYQHPSPLENSHRNPFKTTPPSLPKGGNASIGEFSIPESTSGHDLESDHSKSPVPDDSESDHYVVQLDDECVGPIFEKSQYPDDSGPEEDKAANRNTSCQNNYDTQSVEGPVEQPIPCHSHPTSPRRVSTNQDSSGIFLSINPNSSPPRRTYHSIDTWDDRATFTNGIPSPVLSTFPSTEGLVENDTLPVFPQRSFQPLSRSPCRRTTRSLGTRTYFDRFSDMPFSDPPYLYADTNRAESEPPVLPRFSSPSTSQRQRFSRTFSTKQRSKRFRNRDDIVRERLRNLDTGSPEDIYPSSPNRVSRVDFPLPRDPYTTRFSFPESIDMERRTRRLYVSANGQYAFTQPPKLRGQTRRGTLQRDSIIDIAAQKRLGRRIIFESTLAMPVGWAVVVCIAVGSAWPDRLLRWRSKGTVYEFHKKERRLARLMCWGYVAIIIIVAVVTATIVVVT